ncbi:sodium:calcium antiporter [Tautonia sociabilis]|uniref:Sodium:calcium antiporter n=1 Tax=Tautonia sociabilis TaxID=2080755 RepID=A0A432MD03_9BACT|nr:sodium:calcium antiporter [Tautonia sociabilis]RUL82537.1 sodium:calcium antiporter [Tautonia sociabilis]
MEMLTSVALFVLGIAIVVFSAEKLVEGAVGASVGLGVSAFFVGVIFIGFDPENLAVGGAAAYEGASGLALGSILGAAMVAVALAFGVTALLAPMRFEQVPARVLLVPVLAVLLLGALGSDGRLGRWDGVALLLGYILSVAYLWYLGRKGFDIRPEGEVAEALEEARSRSAWRSLGLLALSLVGLVVGSEMLVYGARDIIAAVGLPETVFGMTILALLVSIEELARELPAALKGRPDISFGNVAGSVLAFFLFNAGVIALIRPVEADDLVVRFYYPASLLTILVVSALVWRRRVSRPGGALLVVLYLAFVAGGYLL